MSRYGDWFRAQRSQERDAGTSSTGSAPQTTGTGRRLDLAGIDEQAARESAQIRSLAELAEARLRQRQTETVQGAGAEGSAVKQLAQQLRAEASGSTPAAVQARGSYINSRYQSGRLPGTSQGSEEGTGSGGVWGFRNVENAEAIQMGQEQRYQAQRQAIEQNRQLDRIAQLLDAQAEKERREAEALLPDATLKNLTLDSFRRGYENSILGQETYKAMNGADSRRDEYLQRLEREQFQFAPKGLIQRAVSGAAEQFGQQYRQWTDPRSVAMGGTAATMAFMAGQAGPQALVPEEIITVPAAFTSAMAAGSAISNMEIEAGMAYNEMLENGISEKTARTIALAVGGANAMLEGLQLDELAKGLRVVGGNGATRNTARRIVEELARRGIDIGNETLQEVLQEGVTTLGAQAASKYETGDWAYSAAEVGDRLKDTALSSALTFGAMNAPGFTRNAHAALRDGRTVQTMQGSQTAQAGADSQAIQSALGENGKKNYQYFRERDKGQTPDFNAQYQHYYELARSGMQEEQIPGYPSMTPLGEGVAMGAKAAGLNDGLAEAAETVQRLLDGRAVSDKAIDQALSFPETRRAIEELTGKLPQGSTGARQTVREWEARNTEQSVQNVEQSTENAEQTAQDVEQSALLPEQEGAVTEGAPECRTGRPGKGRAHPGSCGTRTARG